MAHDSGTVQVTGPAQTADLVDQLRASGAVLTYDPDTRTIRTFRFRAAAGPVSAGPRSPPWRKKTFPWPGWPRDTRMPSPFWPSSVPARLPSGPAGESGLLSRLVPA